MSGHWSDWQDPFELRVAVRPDQGYTLEASNLVIEAIAGAGGVSFGYPGAPSATDTDLGAALEQARVAIAGLSAAPTDLPAANSLDCGYQLVLVKAPAPQPIGSGDPVIKADLMLAETYRSFDATAAVPSLPDVPPPLAGTDYAVNPDTGQAALYETPEPSFVAWGGPVDDTWACRLSLGASDDQDYGAGLSEPTLSAMTLIFRALPYQSPADLPYYTAPLFRADAGTELTRFSYARDVVAGQQAPVPLGGLTDPKWTLLVLPAFFELETFPFVDFPVPAAYNTRAFSSIEDLRLDMGTGARPFARFRSPRWRYWVPDVPAPTIAPYLRMTQRDDGAGIARFPRLNSPGHGTGQATSRQAAHTPRVGETNRYT